MFFRLSYHQRIREILPEGFARFIPEKPEPDYKYAQDGAGKNFCTVLFSLIFNLIQEIKTSKGRIHKELLKYTTLINICLF